MNSHALSPAPDLSTVGRSSADDGISIPPLPAPFPAAHPTAREIEGTRFSLRRWLRRLVRRGVRV